MLRTEDFSAVEGVSVRMGLHSGFTDERDGDYFGPVVNRVARLMSIGHGGQILVSGVVREALQADAFTDARFIDLGERRLEDLLQPEHVWQLSVAGLPADFPPLKSLDARPNNLPLQITPLIGRERDIEDVKALLAAHRVVSLLGSGGIGKTRVAQQTGADLIDRFDHGVWFADLAPIRDPELVASVVAVALGVHVPAGQRLDEAIPHLIKSKQMLLILDNCEQVLDAAAALADAIHRKAPGVRILATSREALKIPGEASHRLPSLEVLFWIQGGLAAEGRYWIEAALERVSEGEHPRIMARLCLGLLGADRQEIVRSCRAGYQIVRAIWAMASGWDSPSNSSCLACWRWAGLRKRARQTRKR